MPTTWAARLTPRGYHAVSVKRPDTAARWAGPTRVANDGWKEGDAIVAYDPDDESCELHLHINSMVYLSGPRKGQPAEIGRIKSFFSAADSDHIWLEVAWFWRPERMKLSDDVDWHERELFLEDRGEADLDENSSASIELTPVVVMELHDPTQLAGAPHTFFTRPWHVQCEGTDGFRAVRRRNHRDGHRAAWRRGAQRRSRPRPAAPRPAP